MNFEVGQRWLSEAEPELGLGIIFELGHKSLKVSFPAKQEFRVYGMKSAPLKRVLFHEGEEISSEEGTTLTVENISWEEGLASYHGQNKVIKETELSFEKSLNRPRERLISGLVDSSRSHQLRQMALDYRSKLFSFHARGLMGARLSLIEHQIYVAHEIAARECPRVLLSDEVGLGKTIEACLIIQYLLLRERAKRVLIIVPNSLTYQWFVELLRRFNLSFSIVNQETPLERGENPFENQDLVITSMGLLKGSKKAFEMIESTQWDLLVVDEAHQIKTTREEKSHDYEMIEKLSGQIPGLVLLTATPEQLGKYSHFSRLKLLDPQRFCDYDSYCMDEKKYRDIALLIDKNEGSEPFSKNDLELWNELFKDESSLVDPTKPLSEDCLGTLIDSHGTGRVFIRNMRSRIDRDKKLFPKRNLCVFPLESGNEGDLSDKKDQWLVNFLNEKKGEKVLLICQSKKKILFLEEFLKTEIFNIKVAVFHSDLTLLSRDRQAAYFADPEGAQILLCTEIGSEGRNFQFAQDLVLYDLPVSPDLLEQRIGRLDRIGQKGDIFIHVPYLKNTYEEGVFNWLHQGLGAFEKPLKLTYSFFNSVKEKLFSFLDKYPNGKGDFGVFLEGVKKKKEVMEKEIDEGRDKLIELNSFNEKKGKDIVLDILKFQRNNDLKSFMEEVFHNFGVDFEDLDDRGDDYFIKPGSNMFVPHFPELPNDGLRVTFSRERALEREEITFLTWDHAMVVGILELILGGEIGNVSMRIRKKRKKEAIYLECHFWLECMAPKKLDAERFFPPTSFRTLVDLKGQDLAEKWSSSFIEENTDELRGDIIQKAIPILRKNIPSLISLSEEKAKPMVKNYISEKTKEMNVFCDSEISRLEHMKARNLSVRDEEILAHKQLKNTLEKSFNESKMRLDSVRVIF